MMVEGEVNPGKAVVASMTCRWSCECMSKVSGPRQMSAMIPLKSKLMR